MPTYCEVVDSEDTAVLSIDVASQTEDNIIKITLSSEFDPTAVGFFNPEQAKKILVSLAAAIYRLEIGEPR